MKEFNGDLKGFPEEVVEKMLERQVEQGNKRDVSVFEKDSWADQPAGGFDWSSSPEELLFWCAIIEDKDFELFFKLYPKQEARTVKKDEAIEILSKHFNQKVEIV